MSRIQFDGNKLLHHLDRVNAWSKGQLIYPVYVAFSPSSLCNHHCNFCVYHYKKFEPVYFPMNSFNKLITEFKELGIRSIFFAGDGEPLLNKDCSKMIVACKEASIDVGLNTNGRLISDSNVEDLVENLEFIRVSLNAGDRESYKKIHGCSLDDFDKVVGNIRKMVEFKKKLNSKITIGVQLVLQQANCYGVKKLSTLLKEIGVDYFSVKPFLKHPDTLFDDVIADRESILLDLLEHSKNISDGSFQFVIRNNMFQAEEKRNYKHCLSTPFMIEIDAKGDVYTCGPYIGNPDHVLGNVLRDSFKNVWNSDKANKVRENLSCKLDVSKCMPSCRPNSVNEVLWKIKNPPQHVNYI